MTICAAASRAVCISCCAMLLGLPFIATQSWAGPVEFGISEVSRAAAERGVATPSLRTELSGGDPESYVLQTDAVKGGDARGLMYGLLEAADQIRRSGRVQPAAGKPATRMRGIRSFFHNEEMSKEWYFSKDYWNSYFAMLAKNRFNRFNLVFAHSTNYLSPPFPFWVEIPEFTDVRALDIEPPQRQRNLQMLCDISQAASDHGIDFTLGVWQFDAMRGQLPSVVGITRKNIGPYSYAALKKILHTCPAIRSVQIRTKESGIADEQEVSFYRDWIYRAVREAGRSVTLDLRSHFLSSAMMEAATSSDVPVRISSKYWAEHMVRPYQPVETGPMFSYLDLLRRPPRKYDFFWEIWSLGDHRLLLWGDPDYIRRIVPTFALANSTGFEIDAPLAQKGYGNMPGTWGIFAENQYNNHEDRKFWNWEFERYWLFYLLWGRLSYDPEAPNDLWLRELRIRFDDAASDASMAYQSASKVISEILAAHMPEPDQTIWPEINPGGLIAYYKDAASGDPRFVASPAEFAHNYLNGIPSAKQGPRETAQLLDGLADQIDAAVTRVESKLGGSNKEWRGTETDFKVLAYLARYHARKQEAAYSLSWFYETGNPASLDSAEVNIRRAKDIWSALVQLTDGLFPSEMSYGMETGHWKDKLTYVDHDLRWIVALKRTWKAYGKYDYRFDFGEDVQSPRLESSDAPFMANRTVEPRFTPAHPTSNYSEDAGYGWIGQTFAALFGQGPISSPRASNLCWSGVFSSVRATSARPTWLPQDPLFGDYLLVPSLETFRVRTGEGLFDAVKLYADGSEESETLRAQDGVVDIVFPQGRVHQVSGLVIRDRRRASEKNSTIPVQERYPKTLPRPNIVHVRPRVAVLGQALQLEVKAEPSRNVTAIRLHYRPLNTWERVRTLEVSGAVAKFTIPADDISAEWDLLYYFEVLNLENAGWFQPDPGVATPYYVVPVRDALYSNEAASRKISGMARQLDRGADTNNVRLAVPNSRH